MSDAPPAASSSSSPRNLTKVLGFAFAGVNLACLGLGAYLVYVSTLGVKAKVTTETEAKQEVEKFEDSLRGGPVLYAMEPISTNLDGVPRRLIRAEVNLEMLDEEGFEEVITQAPKARDAIMRIFNNKSFNDIESVQGKLHLKSQIMADLNALLEKGSVKNVYFSDFVVQ
jgi:flagellar FliL protein